MKRRYLLLSALVVLAVLLAGCAGDTGADKNVASGPTTTQEEQNGGAGGADTQAPSVPTGLIATAVSATQINLTWSPATDNVGVTGYKVYRDGTQIATSLTTAYSDTGLSSGATYTYTVAAYDAAANTSALSIAASATRTNGPPPTVGWSLLKLPDTGQTTKYLSVFGEDADYTINPPSYTNNGNGTITDNVTGLVYQKEDDGTTRSWEGAGTYCDDFTLGGYTDWRLPSDIELMSIVDYGRRKPAINSTYFPNTQSSDYWSSSTYAANTGLAWYVNFNLGDVLFNFGNKTYTYYVRCVRGGQ